MRAYLDALQRYFDFRGRTSRSGYWLFVLVNLAVAIVAFVLDNTLNLNSDSGVGPFFVLVYISHLIPQLSALVRRLHDIGRSGWWALLLLTGLGALVLVIFACLPSEPRANAYEPAASGAPAPDVAAASGTARVVAPPTDIVAELERLAQLRINGSLTEAEYETMKARVLSKGT